LVLAITVLIFPIVASKNSKTIDWPMMMFSSILFYAFAWDNIIEFWEGVILVTILVGFILFLIQNSRKNSAVVDEDYESPSNTIMTYVYLLSGLVGLKFGADWLLEGAVGIAEEAGMSKKVIGVTIIAFGTSVPELVASGMAAYRKQTDISIGNLVGSNIFNIMIVIGITAIVKDIKVDPTVMGFDMIWMLAISLALLPLMLLGKKMGRVHGILLLGTYFTFIGICLASISG
jgi:cation:H+ antiporter